MNYRLPKNSEKSAYVERKFDEIAKQYDRFNDFITFRMHRSWKRFVAEKTRLRPGGCCLDLCCGTGDIARTVKNHQPEAIVTALDFSGNMLSLAILRQEAASEKIHFLRGDAMNPPFSTGHFDAVTVGFGLRNVSDLEKCVGIIYGLLKPSGILVSLDIGKVRFPIIRELNHVFLFRIVPFIGRRLMPGQEMFEYLPHSSLNYPDQKTLKHLMLETGFKQVDVHDFVFGAACVHVAFKSFQS